jgi:hypothetical protein
MGRGQNKNSPPRILRGDLEITGSNWLLTNLGPSVK